MATETQTTPPAPELTILNRVASIPLISESLTTLHSTLASHPYTSTPYAKAADLSKAAYATAQPYAEPLTVRLAPLITRADDIANKSLDAVVSRYPYPFQTTTDGLFTDIKSQRDQAVGVASKTIDDRVRTPAYQLVNGIDSRFSPVVDVFESAVNKIQGHSGAPSSASDSSETSASSSSSSQEEHQYQRAYRLSVDLKDTFYVYSGEQITQIQHQNVLVQRATDTAYNLTNIATSSIGAAQARVHSLSDSMLQELHKLQTSTSTLPTHLQSSFREVSDGISATITDLSTILKSDAPLNDKAARVRVTVVEKVQPVLAMAAVRVQEALGAVMKRQPIEQKEEAPLAAPTHAPSDAPAFISLE